MDKSVIIGATAVKLTGGNTSDAMTGAATALDGEKYNRELHKDEIKLAKENVKLIADRLSALEGREVTEEEAEGRIIRQMLRWADVTTSVQDSGFEDKNITSLIGRNSVNATPLERLTSINQDAIKPYEDLYAEGEKYRFAGLPSTQKMDFERVVNNAVVGTAAIAIGGYYLAPEVVGSLLQNPISYPVSLCLANPVACTNNAENLFYGAAGMPSPNPGSLLSQEERQLLQVTNAASKSTAIVAEKELANASRVEVIAGSDIRHINGAIAEAQGYNNAVSELNHIGIQMPGKVTVSGPDYVTFDPVTKEIYVWDAKYSFAGKFPNNAEGFYSEKWISETQNAITNISDPVLKNQVQNAFNAGKIRWEIFKWPQ